jgi:hypothetical protein
MQAGVRQAVATKISGYSTPHFLQRYNIIDESELHETVKKWTIANAKTARRWCNW